MATVTPARGRAGAIERADARRPTPERASPPTTPNSRAGSHAVSTSRRACTPARRVRRPHGVSCSPLHERAIGCGCVIFESDGTATSSACGADDVRGWAWAGACSRPRRPRASTAAAPPSRRTRPSPRRSGCTAPGHAEVAPSTTSSTPTTGSARAHRCRPPWSRGREQPYRDPRWSIRRRGAYRPPRALSASARPRRCRPRA